MPRRALVIALSVLGLSARAAAQTSPVPPPAPSPVPCSPDAKETVELEGPGPKATLELEGPPPDLQLVHHVAPYGWRSVCEAPCTVLAPTSGEYKLRGSGITESDAFRLDPAGGNFRVRVAPVSQSALIAGTILIYAGVSVIPSGALAVVSGYVTDEPPLVTVGYVTMAIGAVMAGIGLPLFLANSKSDVVVERSARGSGTNSVQWRSLAAGRRPERRFAVPLVSGTF